jgi:hypothetical protein
MRFDEDDAPKAGLKEEDVDEDEDEDRRECARFKRFFTTRTMQTMVRAISASTSAANSHHIRAYNGAQPFRS